jgi:hypothetical protein
MRTIFDAPMKIPNNRKGFTLKEPEVIPPALALDSTSHLDPMVYWNSKLKHSGVTSYKVFENCHRRPHLNSLSNLLNAKAFENKDLIYYIDTFNGLSSDDDRSRLNDEVCDILEKEDYEKFLKQTRQIRNINPSQSKKVKSLVDKLAYYTATRVFTDTKEKNRNMKVAFITLTSPASATNSQIISAFNHFLDYLQRTANCVYVWKKELGEQNLKLHFHIVVNNFVPYYIISWKWKRLLIAEGVEWPLNEKGKDTTSHYRIELPRKAKEISHYIAKYMSKAYDLPGKLGYVYGNSRILTELKEKDLSEWEIESNEYSELKKNYKVIEHDYTQHICCNLLHVRKIAPKLAELFEEQYVNFSEKITLPQKFKYVAQYEPITDTI